MKNKYRNRRFWAGVLLGTLIIVCLFGCGKETAEFVDAETLETESESLSEELFTEQPDTQAEVLYVYVCGEVKQPGVYQMPEGSRVCDLFLIAGGLTADAAVDYWNQARLLEDGEMIYVPTVEEAVEREPVQIDKETSFSGKININTASKEELMTLSGIGASKAQAIIAYRQEYGAFSCIEDIMKVEGIKEAVFQKIRDEIVVN